MKIYKRKLDMSGTPEYEGKVVYEYNARLGEERDGKVCVLVFYSEGTHMEVGWTDKEEWLKWRNENINEAIW